jgi:FAD/FMN-containing dehydrogenase
VRFHDVEALVDALGAIVASGVHAAEPVDYVDGVVFSATESYLVLGRRTDEPGPTSDYTGRRIFYRSIRHDGTTPRRDVLSTGDYLWRWDTDWFWCSRAFGAQHRAVRRVWPRRWLRSSVYWRLVALDRRFDVADRLEARQGRPPRERVVQDVELPLATTAAFLRWFLREVPIEPIWLCPLRLRSDEPWTLYPLRPGETYVNVGFWSTVATEPGAAPGATNRRIEHEVGALGGHKSLYSESFYDREEFDRLYGGPAYAVLKRRWDPGGRFPGLHDKAVRGA